MTLRDQIYNYLVFLDEVQLTSSAPSYEEATEKIIQAVQAHHDQTMPEKRTVKDPERHTEDDLGILVTYQHGYNRALAEHQKLWEEEL